MRHPGSFDHVAGVGKTIGVMGSGDRSHRVLARPLGVLLARLGVNLLTGGGLGTMAEVSRSFSEIEGRLGRAIGVLPGGHGSQAVEPPPGYPNRWVEIVIQTHLGARGRSGLASRSRNHINVLSSDGIVFLPGGEGTRSELELAIRYRRPAIAYLGKEGSIAGAREDLGIALAAELVDVESFLLPLLAI